MAYLEQEGGFAFDPAALVGEVREALKAVTELDPLWMHGVVHPGGPHYRLEGTLGPVSFGEDECVVLGHYIMEFSPANCFIIGNAFGMSSVYIAKAMESCGGRSVITLDNKSEGDGERCARVAEDLRKRTNARLLENHYGRSPDDIMRATGGEKFDLVLVDGLHAHPQVTEDYHGLKDVLHDKSVICWHDYWLAGVPESVAAAESDGFLCTKVNCSGELVFGTRDQAVFDRILRLFPNSEAPLKRTRYAALALLYVGLLKAGLRRRLSLR
ncbi:MAG: class I SAM-dependent methyltransferase [Silicimonas sp.]